MPVAAATGSRKPAPPPTGECKHPHTGRGAAKPPPPAAVGSPYKELLGVAPHRVSRPYRKFGPKRRVATPPRLTRAAGSSTTRIPASRRTGRLAQACLVKQVMGGGLGG